MKKMFPEAKICIDPSCYAGVTPEKHAAALETMRSCRMSADLHAIKQKAAVKAKTLQTGQLCKVKPNMCKAIYFTWFFRQKTAVNFQFSVHFPG